jgi:molybdopterin-guanine dinucleotide biosynthesis protein A
VGLPNEYKLGTHRFAAERNRSSILRLENRWLIGPRLTTARPGKADAKGPLTGLKTGMQMQFAPLPTYTAGVVPCSQPYLAREMYWYLKSYVYCTCTELDSTILTTTA